MRGNPTIVLAALTLAAFFAACEDNSYTPPPSPPPPPPPQTRLSVSGNIFNDAADWMVTARTIGGELVGTDSYIGYDQYYISKEGKVVPAESVEVTLTGGSYHEPADNTTVTVLDTNTVMTSYQLVTNITMEADIGFLSTVATGLAQYNYANGIEGEYAAYIYAPQDIEAFVGFNILTSDFVDTTDSNIEFTTLSDAVKHSLFHAAISQMTLDWSMEAGNASRVRPYTTVDFMTLAYQDIKADGLLDGIGEGGALLVLGQKAIDANTYRHDLALALFKYQENANNQTGFSKPELLDFAVSINDSTADLLGGAGVIEIDEGGPVISNYMPEDGGTITSFDTFSAHVYDPTGIYVVTWLIDDVEYAGNSSSILPIVFEPSYGFNSIYWNDGTHFLTIEVENVNGSVSRITHTVTFDNTP